MTAFPRLAQPCDCGARATVWAESSGSSLIVGRAHAEGSCTKIRVAVAGDHAASQAELRRVIEAQPDMEVVADTPEASSDVAVVDVAALSAGLVETIERIRRQSRRTRLLVLATLDDPVHLYGALAAGATGYVLKPTADQELLSAIRAVHRGRTFIDVGRPDGFGPAFLPDAAPPTPRLRGATRQLLSPRERQVLALLVRGYANHEIAERLRVGVKTVETHRARLAKKLGVRTRVQLVEYALLNGLLTAESQHLSDIA